MKDEELNKIRMRFVPTGMKVREALDEQGNPTGKKIIEGCAIVFNRETVLWEDAQERVSEVIQPSCFTEEFLREQDIKLNLLHDRDSTIARYNKGEGTLKIFIREDGVWFQNEVEDFDLTRRAVALIENGTYTGCSFEFRAKDYDVINRSVEGGKDDYLISHRSFDCVRALTIAMDPAYKETSVKTREWEDLTRAEKELLKKEEEEREARHLLAMREAQTRKAQRERQLALMELAGTE